MLDRPLDTALMPPSPFFASIGMGDLKRNGFMSIQVPEGGVAKNRAHLDSDDVDGEVARVIDLGATHVHDEAEYGLTWTAFADPEGSEFCIVGPHHLPLESKGVPAHR